MESGYHIEEFGKHCYTAGLTGAGMDTGKDRGKDFGYYCKSDTHQSRKIQKDLFDYSRIVGKGKSYSMDG